jgi:uncharacterized protein (TIGR02646 family)
MKWIRKQKEPEAFTDWKALANEGWQPTYDILSGDPKEAVKTALMKEQGYICCYCERRLTDIDSHIEHFQPQSDPTVDPLDFSNMLCSCQDQLKKGEPRHCGVLKDDWFDNRMLISPLTPDCETRFAYTGRGRIKPAQETDEAAIETIARLGLDIPKLNAMRANAIEPFLDDDISQEEMQQFVAGYLRKDENGQYGEFWTTISYLFGNPGSH